MEWIPNHAYLKARGIDDNKADCLRNMARFSYPQSYFPDKPNFGVSEGDYRLLEAFYENGSKMVDLMQLSGAVRFREFRMWDVDILAPDYADHLPENKVRRGRALEPDNAADKERPKTGLAQQLENYIRREDIPILTSHLVKDIIKQHGRVIGVVAEKGEKQVNIRARRGVVFATGGYAHNPELINKHRESLLYGACASPAATGDLMTIASGAGARMGTLNTAWRTQVLMEEALSNRVLAAGTFYLPGDSMIANCASCHLTGQEPGQMALYPEVAWQNLVNVPSVESELLRVNPGSPDQSYLILKIDGAHLDAGGSGTRMPFNAEPLSDEIRAQIRTWVSEGALNN